MSNKLIENEKRIISFARAAGDISKPDICSSDGVGCGWATAHKCVNRLLSAGILIKSGTRKRQSPYGRNALTYSLSESHYIALGIDIEKTDTTVVLVSLGNKLLAELSFPSPPLKQKKELSRFLNSCIKKGLSQASSLHKEVCGIGVGIPFPGSFYDEDTDFYRNLSHKVEQKFVMPCSVENNVSAYTDYLRYTLSLSDFCLISIRTGIGGGLVMGNSLRRGMGNGSEIGHLNTGGCKKCFCGRTGCLETEISLPALYTRYRKTGGKEKDPLLIPVRARKGEKAALKTVQYAASLLADTLTALHTILDLPQYIIAGKFPESGSLLTEYIEEHIPQLAGQISYKHIKDNDFNLSSAHLIHKSFITKV